MNISKKLRRKVYEKSNGFCWYCGCDISNSKWHVDHVVPIRRDVQELPQEIGNRDIEGLCKMLQSRPKKKVTTNNPELHTLENLVPACPPCNNFKSDKGLNLDSDFRQGNITGFADQTKGE